LRRKIRKYSEYRRSEKCCSDPLIMNEPSGRRKYLSRAESDLDFLWEKYCRLWIPLGWWTGSDVTEGVFFVILYPIIRQPASVDAWYWAFQYSSISSIWSPSSRVDTRNWVRSGPVSCHYWRLLLIWHEVCVPLWIYLNKYWNSWPSPPMSTFIWHLNFRKRGRQWGMMFSSSFRYRA